MPLTDKTQRTFVLISAILASSMAFIDGTALNVALPAIQRSLHLTGIQMLWVVNAYTLFLASLMLAGGALGDIYGKRKIFITGILIFTVFSALCGISANGTMLVIMRGFQGIGGALMVPGSLSIIGASYNQKERGTAIGTWSMFSAFTTLLGPVLGGVLAEAGLWRFIFFINIPIGIICTWMLWSKVKEPASTQKRKLDLTGAFLVTLASLGLVFGFIQAGEYGFANILIQVSLILGTLILGVFIWWEWKTKRPMLPLTLFRSPTFSAANAMTFLVYGALAVVMFFLPLNLIQVQGYSESFAGFAILPFAGLIAILGRISGKVVDQIGPKIPLIIGPIITGVGFYLFSTIGQTGGSEEFARTFLPPLLVSGLGMGITVVPITAAVMKCVMDKDTGIASGVNNTISRIANVLALAIFGAIALITFQQELMGKLSENGLSNEQITYMQQKAADLAGTQPKEAWDMQDRQFVRTTVKSSFILVFNRMTQGVAFLCWLGALISILFIRKDPMVVRRRP